MLDAHASPDRRRANVAAEKGPARFTRQTEPGPALHEGASGMRRRHEGLKLRPEHPPWEASPSERRGGTAGRGGGERRATGRRRLPACGDTGSKRRSSKPRRGLRSGRQGRRRGPRRSTALRHRRSPTRQRAPSRQRDEPTSVALSARSNTMPSGSASRICSCGHVPRRRIRGGPRVKSRVRCRPDQAPAGARPRPAARAAGRIPSSGIPGGVASLDRPS